MICIQRFADTNGRAKPHPKLHVDVDIELRVGGHSGDSSGQLRRDSLGQSHLRRKPIIIQLTVPLVG